MHSKIILFTLTALLGLSYHSSTSHAAEFPTRLKPITEIKKITDLPSTEVQSETKTPTPASTKDFAKIQAVLNQHMGQPYTWGGNGPTTFDCSGLTKFVFEHALNIHLKRTAEQQFNQFPHVQPSATKPGDLIFFSYNDGQSIDHVGIVVAGDHMMIDAQSKGVMRESYLAPWWKDSIAGFARVLK
jgi:cell wall-associated NlpC family hydrolase